MNAERKCGVYIQWDIIQFYEKGNSGFPVKMAKQVNMVLTSSHHHINYN